MTTSFVPEVYGEAIIIRYDGLDAERHEIDMALLAESLRGLSRIVGVVGNFAATERIIQHRDSFVLKVVVAPPEAHCFELTIWLKWINENPLVTTTVGGLVVSLVGYIFHKAAGAKEEMKHLSSALEVAIRELGHRDDAVVEKLIGTINKMADGLRPAARQSVAPIGQTAQTLTIKDAKTGEGSTFSAADKEAILSESPLEVGSEAIYELRFTEMDMESGACKVALPPEGEARLNAKITDPEFMMANNRYALALAAHTSIKIVGKPTIRDGEVERLFISNTAE